MDGTNSQKYLKEIERCLNAGCRQLVIDLSQVSFVDTHGLGVLVKGWRLTQQKQIPFRVRGVIQEAVKIVFQVTNIERLFPVEYTTLPKNFVKVSF